MVVWLIVGSVGSVEADDGDDFLEQLFGGGIGGIYRKDLALSAASRLLDSSLCLLLTTVRTHYGGWRMVSMRPESLEMVGLRNTTTRTRQVTALSAPPLRSPSLDSRPSLTTFSALSTTTKFWIATSINKLHLRSC